MARLESLPPQKKYQELGDRTGRPNPAQLRKLDALFHGIPGYGTISPEKAFRAFLQKRFGIEHPKFLDLIQYEKALKAVREMRARGWRTGMGRGAARCALRQNPGEAVFVKTPSPDTLPQ